MESVTRALIAETFPDEISWLAEKAATLVRPAGFLAVSAPTSKSGLPQTVAAQGSTYQGCYPDVPFDAPWRGRAVGGQALWQAHAQEGESFRLQLCLEDIPAPIREQFPDLPVCGMVWVTIDLSGSRWQGHAYFDPRPAHAIRWLPRPLAGKQPTACSWTLRDTLTYATDATLPEVSADFRPGGLCEVYDSWWQTHFSACGPEEVQLGGWLHPIQGDADFERRTLLLAMKGQEFGDHGAVYLHYSKERGFFVELATH